MGNWYMDPIDGEVSHEEIIKKAENGDFHEWDFQPFDFQENGYEDVIDKLKSYTAVEYGEYESKRDEAKKKGDEETAKKYQAEMDRMVEEVYQIYRSKNIYPIQYYSELGIMQEIEKCIAYNAKFDGDTVSCVDGETEFFTGKGWKRIDQYIKGDKVLQYNDDGTAELVEPLQYIKHESSEPFYEYDSNHLNSCLTGNHDVVYKGCSPDKRSYTCCKIKQQELLDRDTALKVPIFFDLNGSVDLCEDKLTLAVITYFLAKNIHSSGTFCLSYSKKRVLGEILDLLEKLNIDYTTDEYSRSICFKDLEVQSLVDDFFSDKWYLLSNKTKRSLIHIVFKWVLTVVTKKPGRPYEQNGYLYFESKEQADVWQFIVSSTGVSGCLMKVKGNMYAVRSSNLTSCSYGTYKMAKRGYKTIDDINKYCFTVPSHMLVLRRKNKIFVTGNCGAGVGTTLCKFLFPNLEDTPSKHDLDKADAESIYAKFMNEQYLKRAIKFCFSYKNGCPVPTSVEGGLRLVGSAPSNFRPMNAKAVYERFCPKGGTIFDFCCVSGDTEYFNGYSWKPISEYTEGELVLQFNEDGTSELVNPIQYIHYQSDSPFFEHNEDLLPTCLTGNHDVVVQNGALYEKIKFEDLMADTDESRFEIPMTCILKDTSHSICLSPESIAMIALSLLSEGRVQYTSEFLSEDEDGCLILTDRVLMLTKECRELLLSALGVTELNVMLSADGNYISLWGSEQNARIIANLYNLTVDEGRLIYEYDADLGCYGLECVSTSCSNYDMGEITEIYEKDKYCFTVPSHMLVLRRKGVMFITGNCGFGGRMLGCLSSKNNYRYVGTDPCTETMYHLHELGEYIEMVTGREDSYELHCCGSEEFRGKPNSIDFAFSSPPYFDLEVYSDEPTQCYNKFPELNDWLEGFVRPTIQNIGYMLKPGRVYAVNIADFKVGTGGECHYVDEWIRISTEEGMPLYDTVYLGVTARAGSKQQANGELKKENILIFKKPLAR